LDLLRVDMKGWSKKVPPLEEPIWKIIDCVSFEINKPRMFEFVVLMPKYIGPGIYIILKGINYWIKGYKEFFGLI